VNAFNTNSAMGQKQKLAVRARKSALGQKGNQAGL
jgi:hypothetical protein